MLLISYEVYMIPDRLNLYNILLVKFVNLAILCFHASTHLCTSLLSISSFFAKFPYYMYIYLVSFLFLSVTINISLQSL